MDVEGDAAAFAWAFGHFQTGSLWTLMLLFSLGWFICYCFICPWIKVWLINRKKTASPKTRKIPVLASHLLFSLIFVNPYILFHLWLDYVGFFFYWLEFKIPYAFVLIALCFSFGFYFVLLPVIFELLLFKSLHRLKYLHWFKRGQPLGKHIAVGLLTSGFAFLVAYGIYCVADYFWV